MILAFAAPDAEASGEGECVMSGEVLEVKNGEARVELRAVKKQKGDGLCNAAIGETTVQAGFGAAVGVQAVVVGRCHHGLGPDHHVVHACKWEKVSVSGCGCVQAASPADALGAVAVLLTCSRLRRRSAKRLI